MAEEEKDKSEPATPFKLEEARRRGQVVKSLDINSLFILGALLVVLLGWGRALTREAAGLAQRLFAMEASSVGNVAATTNLAEATWMALLGLLAPFMVAGALAGLISNLIQTGPVFSGHPIKPDFQRLNPANGFKRLFSMRSLFETGKTLFKLAAFVFVAYLALAALLPGLLGLQHGDPKGYLLHSLDQATALMFKLLLVLAVIALLDLAFTRWDYGKRMRMSRRELKEEIKRREGDPQVRSRLRELRRELAKRAQSIKRVPEADVLITNPDHYAVALRYERVRMPAPCVIAKGAGELAARMKHVARRAGVPLHEDVLLARRLFAEGEVDQPVGERLFEAVARVYATVYARRRAAPSLEVHL